MPNIKTLQHLVETTKKDRFTQLKDSFRRLPTNIKIILLAILLPSVLSLIYFLCWASPMYIAQARFALRSADETGSAGGLASLFISQGGSTGADSHIVAEYISSPDIMEEINRDLNIFGHFSDKKHDVISRLSANATRQEKLDYWQKVVSVSFDPENGIIALSVRAYSPSMAKRLAEAVLEKSERLVNVMNLRSRDDAILLANIEVSKAEERVRKAQLALRAFRDKNGMLDPVGTAGGLQGIVGSLESEAAMVRAKIAESSSFMSGKAPEITGLRARLKALEQQIVLEKQRLAGNKEPGSLSSVSGEYEDLQIESGFAREQLLSAMTSLEAARVKALAKSRYVTAFLKPALPDEPLYPRPFLYSFYVLTGSLTISALLSLIIAAVREHAGF